MKTPDGSAPRPNVWHQRRAQRVRCMPGLGRAMSMEQAGVLGPEGVVLLPVEWVAELLGRGGGDELLDRLREVEDLPFVVRELYLD